MISRPAACICAAISRVGKTSLLLAGVSPRLAQTDPAYETIYARALEDPAEAIRRSVRLRLHDAELPTQDPLVDFLAAATRALGRPLVIVLDQFEEFFLRLSPQFRAAFIGDLAAIYETHDLPVKLVLSLREDWLAAVGEIERRIPEIFRNRMRVLPLSRQQAQDAIAGPVAQLGVSYEPALVARLLDDLANSANGDVMPPQIQLVCSALYKRLPPGERTLTMASYTALGAARSVLQQYLEDELKRLNRDDRALARGALTELVTSQGTKAVKSTAELALGLNIAEATLLPVLELLVQARLLRVVERDNAPVSYELAHEYLIREIELEADAKMRKQAEELIRQEVDNWQRFGTLLAADKLAVVNDVRAALRLDSQAQELLLRSALDVGEDVAYWLKRMADHEQRARVLADKALTRVAAVRQRTATVLGTQDTPESVEPLLRLALHDGEGSVRGAAQRALTQLAQQRPAVVAQLQESVKSADRNERRMALETLSLLPLRDIPPTLRPPALAAGARVQTTNVVRSTVATPAGRATLTITSAVLLLLTAAIVFSYSSYYVVANPSPIREINATIVIRRSQPPLKLPGIDQELVNTGIAEAAIDESAR